MRREQKYQQPENQQASGYLTEKNIIIQTKKIVAGKSQVERFEIARKHLFNALDYKTPRLDIERKDIPISIKLAYNIQTFFMWRSFLLLIAYLFMYSAFFGHNHPSYTLIGVELGFLSVLIFDIILEIYHKLHNKLKHNSRFQLRFYIRAVSLTLLLVDEIIVLCRQDLPVRPFLILRCVLPVLYDPQMRKMFYALFSAYIDILVYIIFYMIVIIMFGIMANQFIYFPPGTEYDDLTGNYPHLGKAIYLMYVLTTFDAYPDNQLVAIRLNIWIYAFFIVFIFLNALLFVAIPTNILLSSVRSTRSKTIMIDEIDQQHNLIMGFIALGGDSTQSIPYQKVIRFLLYVFNNEARYLDKITQICKKLDEKVNGTIEATEFMQLCKIIQSRSYLRPPRHKLWKRLTPFQQFLDNRLKLKAIIKSNAFQMFFGFFVLFAFINCLLTIYTPYLVFDIIDDVIIIIILTQILFKIIGLGPELYFSSYLNIIDLIIILVGLFFQIAPREITPRNAAVFAKMFRIFRITMLVRYLKVCFKISYKSEIYLKLTKLFNQIALLIPIFLKFFPLYMISFYFLGVIGVQAFWYQTQISPSDSNYSAYNEFSNFNTLLGSQFIFVQVLTEAGWSAVAYDHAFRYGVFGLTMLFFVLCHQIIVIILTSLFKGIAWQNYNTIAIEQQQFQEKLQADIQQDQMLKQRMSKLQQIKQKSQRKQILLPTNLITRQIYQKKVDLEILNKLKQLILKKNQVSKIGNINANQNFEGTSAKLMVKRKNQQKQQPKSALILKQNKKQGNPIESIITNQFQGQQTSKAMNIFNGGMKEQISQQNFKSAKSIEQSITTNVQIQDLKQEDIQKEIDQLLDQITFHSKVKFSLKMIYPQSFIHYLKDKIKPIVFNNFPAEQFNVDRQIFSDSKSLNLLAHGLHTLMSIQTSQREHRSIILHEMVQKGIISGQKAEEMLTEKSEYDGELTFDYNWIIRQNYLSNISEDVIKTFQMEYFSSVYGESFKQINKSTIFPLMKLQARMCYCLNNILRYRELGTHQFFRSLIHIQNKISTRLLKQGSLCKFVYQINTNSDSWFTVQLKDSNQLRVHFIKNGVWVYHRDLNKDQIYTARDLFHWEKLKDQEYKDECAKYIKSFYQDFQSLAFCIDDYDTFFDPHPQRRIYDLYTFFKEVDDNRKLPKKKNETNLTINKIMFVMLSKQGNRKQNIMYKLSDLQYSNEQIEQYNIKNRNAFKLDESEGETFKKITRLQKSQQLYSFKQGLPYAYIVNFLMQVKQTLTLNENNFVYHVQKLLNQHFKDNGKIPATQPKLMQKNSILPKFL